mgnify:CR=1 FL=1
MVALEPVDDPPKGDRSDLGLQSHLETDGLDGVGILHGEVVAGEGAGVVVEGGETVGVEGEPGEFRSVVELIDRDLGAGVEELSRPLS